MNLSTIDRMKAERGPRWLVTAKIRAGEYDAMYAPTAEFAEQLRERWADPDTYGRRSVTVVPPQDAIDLEALGRTRRDAQRALDEATSVLRAGVMRALEAGRAEAEVARAAAVDRQTVRAWAGKQAMNRG